MFEWTQNSIRFRKDAAEYGGFDAELAVRVRAHLAPDMHVCDAGCGLGYLSLALAPHVRRVTAADCSPLALDTLRKNAKLRGLSNIDIAEGDLFAMRPAKKYDAMVFCLFGGTTEALRAIRAQCRGKALLIKKYETAHRFTPEGKRASRRTLARTRAALEALHVPYEMETFSLEMGQPLRSPGEAALFFETYGANPARSAEAAARDLCRLTRTGRADFPLYLPARRELGMILLHAGDLPDVIESIEPEEN